MKAEALQELEPAPFARTCSERIWVRRGRTRQCRKPAKFREGDAGRFWCALHAPKDEPKPKCTFFERNPQIVPPGPAKLSDTMTFAEFDAAMTAQERKG